MIDQIRKCRNFEIGLLICIVMCFKVFLFYFAFTYARVSKTSKLLLLSNHFKEEILARATTIVFYSLLARVFVYFVLPGIIADKYCLRKKKKQF